MKTQNTEITRKLRSTHATSLEAADLIEDLVQDLDRAKEQMIELTESARNQELLRNELDWATSESAPKDRKILGFFEDMGWHPACWSESAKAWKIAYCAGVPETNPEEPQWNERGVLAHDLCWWREWPSSTHPSRTTPKGYSPEYEKIAAEIREAMANGGTLS